MNNTVKIVPYNQNWPQMFEAEAALIKQALGNNYIAIYHIGSTSVPGLAAKPVIDMIPVVIDITKVDQSTAKMQDLGYIAKGENGMLFRRFFQIKSPARTVNVHIFEQGSPEITRHLKFRDWMCTHEEDRRAYEELKYNLAQKFPDDILAYCFGKDKFVAAIDKKTGYSGLRAVMALTPTEWSAAKKTRQKYFFDKIDIKDPYTWTFDHKDHVHLVMYQGTEIIGYAHLQLWPQKRVAMRIIVIDEHFRNLGHGSQLLMICEKWFKQQGYQALQMESSPEAHRFYVKNGYIPMPFNDPDESLSFPQDIPLGKML